MVSQPQSLQRRAQLGAQGGPREKEKRGGLGQAAGGESCEPHMGFLLGVWAGGLLSVQVLIEASRGFQSSGRVGPHSLFLEAI